MTTLSPISSRANAGRIINNYNEVDNITNSTQYKPQQPVSVVQLNDCVHSVTSVVSNNSSNCINLDIKSVNIQKTGKNKKANKKIDRSRYTCFIQVPSYSITNFNVYLDDKNLDAIIDIVVNQKQYELLYDNIKIIFNNFNKDFNKKIIGKININIPNFVKNSDLEIIKSVIDYHKSILHSTLSIYDLYLELLVQDKLDIFKTLIDELYISFSEKDNNLLFIHACGLNRESILNLPNFKYSFNREYLQYDEYEWDKDLYHRGQFFPQKPSKFALINQLLDYYPNFYNKSILDMLNIYNDFVSNLAYNEGYLEDLRRCHLKELYNSFDSFKKFNKDILDCILIKSHNFNLFNYLLKIDKNRYNKEYLYQIVELIFQKYNYHYIDYILNEYSGDNNEILIMRLDILNKLFIDEYINAYNLDGMKNDISYKHQIGFKDNDFIYKTEKGNATERKLIGDAYDCRLSGNIIKKCIYFNYSPIKVSFNLQFEFRDVYIKYFINILKLNYDNNIFLSKISYLSKSELNKFIRTNINDYLINSFNDVLNYYSIKRHDNFNTITCPYWMNKCVKFTSDFIEGYCFTMCNNNVCDDLINVIFSYMY